MEADNLKAGGANPHLPPNMSRASEPFMISTPGDDFLMQKLSEFADSTLTLGESLMKKIDEIGFRETADKIAKTSEELIKEGSSSSISFLKRTKEALT
jgi:hypothetical protein